MPSADPQSGAAPPRLSPRPLGRTGLQVAPLGLAALSVPAFGRRRAGLVADEVERAFHERGVNTFLVHYLMPEICDGVRRLIRAGHRDRLVLVSEVGWPFPGSVRRGLERHLKLLGTDRLDVWLFTATRWGMLLQPHPDRGFAHAMTGAECYRYVLGHPMVDMAWCAARTAAELDEDVEGVLSGPLAPQRLAEVLRFGDAVHEAARGGRRWMFG
jgi:hypothetical protein